MYLPKEETHGFHQHQRQPVETVELEETFELEK
jgi:hypothetical protein